MNLGLDLSMRLQQKLSFQMIQSLKLLQVNTLQLEQLLKTELEMNPVLEESEELETDEEEPDKEDEVKEEKEEEKELEVNEDDVNWVGFGPKYRRPQAKSKSPIGMSGINDWPNSGLIKVSTLLDRQREIGRDATAG